MVIFHSYVSLPGRVTEKDTIGYDLTTHQRPRWPLGILKTSRNLPPEQEHGDVPHQRGERRSPFLKMGFCQTREILEEFSGILVTSKNYGSFLVG